ncbi:uncharacterized protein LOC132735138 [Ruditapes philippinarum]|uniref:uncharacterized protein LOC132735138 n=1 Tax=Ruditapes philippinarum TaxID=129788 RepID=UPI00295A8F92|nr:uncharacterized protein LOC132735138 [Ruditapes philippinarum]
MVVLYAKVVPIFSCSFIVMSVMYHDCVFGKCLNVTLIASQNTVFLSKYTSGGLMVDFSVSYSITIHEVVSFKIFISSIDAQNGEPCFESIHIQETQASGNYFKTELSAVDQKLRSRITFLFKDLADMTPWILVC